MSAKFAVVVMTTQATGMPHAKPLHAANPGLPIHVWYAAHGSTPAERTHLWRNCDRNIRAWWREHRATAEGEAFLFLEWDVFCNVDLRHLIPPLPPGKGLAAARIMSCVRDLRSYWPFADIQRLPRAIQGLACAAAPLAVLLLSRAALDAILAPAWDPVFEADIFCELRLATIVRAAGFGVVAMPLPGVGVLARRPAGSGLFHPVKYPAP